MNQQALLNTAAAHASAGRLKQAAAAYRAVLSANPDDPHALFGLGELFGRIGRRDDALGLISSAVEHAPDRVSYHLYFAQLLLEAGRRKEALDAADRLLRKQPNSPQGKCLKATALGRLGRTDAAMRLIGEVISRSPDDIEAQCVQAELLHRAGLLGEALAQLQRTLRDVHNEACRRRVLFEMAGILEKLGRYDEAFDAYSKSNTARAHDPAVQALDVTNLSRRMDAYRAHVTPELCALWGRRIVATDDPAPIFIVGFPRSGATLTEHILEALPNTRAAEEKPLLHRTLTELRRLRPGDDLIAPHLRTLDDATVRHLRQFYRRQATSLLDIDMRTTRLIDKQPWNIIEIAAINAIFPDAKVIVTHRDPRDVCLSCFRHPFMLNEANARFLDWRDTARFHTEVTSFWNDMAPRLSLKLYDLQYETLVTSFDAEARRLVTFLGESWNDAVLRFYERSAMLVPDATEMEQVTHAVHTKSVGAWKHYTRQFDEIADLLAPSTVAAV
ncbi:MAG: sulfotransferase [Phycisphaerales bacterium]|nr:sulfotransferase [Phycisphaerales bacterium]